MYILLLKCILTTWLHQALLEATVNTNDHTWDALQAAMSRFNSVDAKRKLSIPLCSSPECFRNSH